MSLICHYIIYSDVSFKDLTLKVLPTYKSNRPFRSAVIVNSV